MNSLNSFYHIGEQIKKFREEKQLSQKELADILGISPGSLFNYEKGTRILPLDIAYKMSEELDFKLDDLFKIPNEIPIEETPTTYAAVSEAVEEYQSANKPVRHSFQKPQNIAFFFNLLNDKNKLKTVYYMQDLLVKQNE